MSVVREKLASGEIVADVRVLPGFRVRVASVIGEEWAEAGTVIQCLAIGDAYEMVADGHAEFMGRTHG